MTSIAVNPARIVMLGATDSDRREVLADEPADGKGLTVLHSADEAPDDFEAKLGAIRRWRWKKAGGLTHRHSVQLRGCIS